MLPPFLVGAGGPVGSGRQPLPWVALDDALGAILFALTDSGLSGPVNTVAPEHTTQAEFARVLGRVLRRPAFAPLPAPAVRLVFGELGEALLLRGARVEPRALARRGFHFRYPGLEGSLRHLLGR
jgi:NAD dependent epimerase/dehydratase family enzyme